MNMTKMADLITCKLCLQIGVDPYVCSSCSMLFCSKCEKNFNNSTCPCCYKSLAIQKNNFAKRLIDQIECECPNKCGVKLTYGDLKSHNDKCEFKVYECKIKNAC